MADKRRLPVLASTPATDGEDAARPPWHWAVFAAVMTFAAWLPLAAIAGALVRAQAARLGDARDGASVRPSDLAATPEALGALARTMVVAHATALSLAALAAGALLGRFGPRAGARHAAAGAAACVLCAVALSWATTGVSAAPLAAVALSGACAAAGVRLARRGPRR